MRLYQVSGCGNTGGAASQWEHREPEAGTVDGAAEHRRVDVKQVTVGRRGCLLDIGRVDVEIGLARGDLCTLVNVVLVGAALQAVAAMITSSVEGAVDHVSHCSRVRRMKFTA